MEFIALRTQRGENQQKRKERAELENPARTSGDLLRRSGSSPGCPYPPRRRKKVYRRSSTTQHSENT